MLAPPPDGRREDLYAGASVHKAAAEGIRSGGGRLPHGEQIQRSFGGYDISNVLAHTGASANTATGAMGASAYATGNHVVLGVGGTDLHTVAHEAAHVVQQRAGVSLSGGVGKAGDPYERHADAVADLAVQGKSAEGLLGQMAGGAGAVAAVQSHPLTEPSSAPDWAPRSASSRDPRAPWGGRIRGTIGALAVTSLGILFVALTGVVGCTEKEPPLTPKEVRGFQHFVARITEDVWPSGAGGVDAESLVFLDPMERRFVESLRSKGVTTLRLVSFDVQLGIIVDLPLERDDESSWLVSFEVSTHSGGRLQRARSSVQTVAAETSMSASPRDVIQREMRA